MNAIDDCGTEFASNLTDVRQISLAKLYASRDAAIDEAVLRILPDESKSSVPVAAFNSSI